jgi:hypothetical protein
MSDFSFRQFRELSAFTFPQESERTEYGRVKTARLLKPVPTVSKCLAPDSDLPALKHGLLAAIGKLGTEIRQLRSQIKDIGPLSAICDGVLEEPNLSAPIVQRYFQKVKRNEVLVECRSESRQLNSGIRCFQYLASPRTLKQLQIEFLEHESGIIRLAKECRELQGRIDGASIECEHLLLKKELDDEEIENLKQKLDERAKKHDKLWAKWNAEKSGDGKGGKGELDETDRVSHLAERLKEWTDLRDQKATELEQLRLLQDNEKAALEREIGDVTFFVTSERVLKEKPPKKPPPPPPPPPEVVETEKDANPQAELPKPKRYVKETSAHLLLPKTLPPRPASDAKPKFFRPAPTATVKFP